MEVAQVILFKRVGIASLLIAPVLALAVPAEAASQSVATMTHSAAPAAVPKVKITGSPAVYSPKTLTATPHWNGVETCTTALESFSITNNTSATQTITSGGKTLGSLGGHKAGGICINTNQVGKTLHYGLKSNSKAKLAVKVT
jgi:hypothetical protein